MDEDLHLHCHLYYQLQASTAYGSGWSWSRRTSTSRAWPRRRWTPSSTSCKLERSKSLRIPSGLHGRSQGPGQEQDPGPQGCVRLRPLRLGQGRPRPDDVLGPAGGGQGGRQRQRGGRPGPGSTTTGTSQSSTSDKSSPSWSRTLEDLGPEEEKERIRIRDLVEGSRPGDLTKVPRPTSARTPACSAGSPRTAAAPSTITSSSVTK